jgi:pyrroline-5-carboxylate reductase
MYSLSDQTLIFVGAGSMSEAIVRGLTKQDRLNPTHITLINRGNLERLNH